MKQVVVTPEGKINSMKLPDPGCNEIGILCQPLFSCISSGTETRGIIEARQKLINKLLKTENLQTFYISVGCFKVMLKLILEPRIECPIDVKRHRVTS